MDWKKSLDIFGYLWVGNLVRVSPVQGKVSFPFVVGLRNGAIYGPDLYRIPNDIKFLHLVTLKV